MLLWVSNRYYTWHKHRIFIDIYWLFQDWEDGLCETDVDGSFLHDNWNKDLRLFADGEDGGQQLLQVLHFKFAFQTKLN